MSFDAELEYTDDGWSEPVPLSVNEVDELEDEIDKLSEQDVYISTAYNIPYADDEVASHFEGTVSTEMVTVSFCPESPGAMEQLFRVLKRIEQSRLN